MLNHTVNDFLDMDNKEVLKENGGKKFDVVLMNPPYGSKTQKTSPQLHYQFVDKMLDISKKQVSIFPSRIINTTSKEYNKYKEKFNKYIIDIEEISSNVFLDTHMPNVGIFVFNDDKNKENIHIKKIDGTEENISSLFDKGSGFTKYEKEIFEYCKVDKPNFNPFRPLGDDKNKYLSEFCDKYINKRWVNNDKYFLITNLANGRINATFISKAIGQICKNTKELKELMLQRRGACCTIMTFDSEKAAENCKIALQNPLMRFFLYRLQDDQSMTARVYVGVPDIDWSDDRVKTDEGLLEVCGCPKDKCKEYADYCKKVIEEVDRKK